MKKAEAQARFAASLLELEYHKGTPCSGWPKTATLQFSDLTKPNFYEPFNDDVDSLASGLESLQSAYASQAIESKDASNFLSIAFLLCSEYIHYLSGLGKLLDNTRRENRIQTVDIDKEQRTFNQKLHRLYSIYIDLAKLPEAKKVTDKYNRLYVDDVGKISKCNEDLLASSARLTKRTNELQQQQAQQHAENIASQEKRITSLIRQIDQNSKNPKDDINNLATEIKAFITLCNTGKNPSTHHLNVLNVIIAKTTQLREIFYNRINSASKNKQANPFAQLQHASSWAESLSYLIDQLLKTKLNDPAITKSFKQELAEINKLKSLIANKMSDALLAEEPAKKPKQQKKNNKRTKAKKQVAGNTSPTTKPEETSSDEKSSDDFMSTSTTNSSTGSHSSEDEQEKAKEQPAQEASTQPPKLKKKKKHRKTKETPESTTTPTNNTSEKPAKIKHYFTVVAAGDDASSSDTAGHPINITNFPADVLSLVQMIQQTSGEHELYLFGGAVRDLYQQEPADDYDFITTLPLVKLQATLNTLGYQSILRGPSADKQTLTITLASGEKIDVISLNLADDELTPTTIAARLNERLRTFDATINALLLNMRSKQLLYLKDYVCLVDLEQRKIRPLRKQKRLEKYYQDNKDCILRAVRLSLMRNYTFSNEMLAAISKNGSSFDPNSTAIQADMAKLFAAAIASKNDLGELEKIFSFFAKHGFLCNQAEDYFPAETVNDNAALSPVILQRLQKPVRDNYQTRQQLREALAATTIAQINQTDQRGWNLLAYAIKRKDANFAATLLLRGASYSRTLEILTATNAASTQQAQSSPGASSASMMPAPKSQNRTPTSFPGKTVYNKR